MLTCVFENGKKVSLRHVVVDNLVLNRKKNKILLVKRAPHLLNGNLYGLIGGYVERDETIKETVEREILEEIGYTVEIGFLFRIKDSPQRPKEDRQNISFVFVTYAKEKIGTADKESQEVRWFDLDKLPNKEDFAFDHFEDITLFKQYLQKPFPLPFIGKP